MYQQDDRDIRAERAEQKLEPRHAMMLRCRYRAALLHPSNGLILISLPQSTRCMAVCALRIGKHFSSMAF